MNQSASCISDNTASTSDVFNLRKSGLLTVAMPTSISLALKSLLTTAYNTLIATSIASFSFQLPSVFLNCFSNCVTASCSFYPVATALKPTD